MNNSNPQTPTCNCNQNKQEQKKEQPILKTKKTSKVIFGTMLSFLIAFFPKCPMCWAAYMSMFGSFGLLNVPYMKWLFPVLVAFLCLHLFLIYKKANEKGYAPFVISLIGASILLSGKFFCPFNKLVLIVGMLFILSGSLWNSFSSKTFKTTLS